MTRDTTDSAFAREIDARSNDGIEVRLLWHPASDRITVAVETALETFELAVAADQALDAFRHPFAYAANGAVVLSASNRHCRVP